MTRSSLLALRDQLTGRDLALLRDVERFRLLSTRQIQRLYFDPDRPSPTAAARACTRTLARLRDVGALRALTRRIGGVRAGSAGFVWYTGPAGDRLLRALDPTRPRGRHNYQEPSRHFALHTLATAELAVQLHEAQRRGELELLDLQTEPANWQDALSRFGTVQTLKPDLLVVTAAGDYEHHWFVEIDLDSEHLPVIARQCLAYQAHRATGRYQADHGLFPAVVWVVPSEQRAHQLRTRIADDPQLDGGLFTVVTSDAALGLLRDATRGEAEQPGEQKEGTPT